MANKSQSTRVPTKSKSREASAGCSPTTATKPYPEFPLTPHPVGQWCKKIRGKLHYFGSFTDGWEAALTRYKDEIDDIMAGRTPDTRNKDGLRLLELCDRWLDRPRQD